MKSIKILLVRPDAIGDMVLMIPLINTLKAYFPHAKIYTLQQAYTAPLLAEHPAVSGVIYDRKKAGEAKGLSGFFAYANHIRSYGFDVAILPYLEPYYAYLVRIAGIPIRIGDGQRILLRPWLSHPVSLHYRNLMRHECQQMAALATGLASDISFVPTMDLYLNTQEKEAAADYLNTLGVTTPYIVVHPASGGGNRPWSAEKYAALISALPYPVLLTGAGPKEAEKITHILRLATKTDHVVNLVNQTSLRLLMGVISGAAVVVGTDTGPTHIAAAFQRPVLCISPTKFVKALRWGPWQTPHLTINRANTCSLVCYPYRCAETTCLDAIAVADAVSAIALLLSKRPPYNAPCCVSVKTQDFASLQETLNSDFFPPKALPDTLCGGLSKQSNTQTCLDTHDMQSSIRIGLSRTLENSQDFYQFLVKLGFHVVWIDTGNPWKLLQTIWEQDLCVIHDKKPPRFWWLLRQVAALRMYVPPVWTDQIANSQAALIACYDTVFREK